MLASAAALAEETFLYIVDVGPNRGAPWQVLRANADGSNPQVFIDSELNRPQDILFLENRGTAIVSNLGSGRITEYDADTGDYVGDWASGIGAPTRLAFGPDGYIYVLQWQGNGRVLRYERDGSLVDEFTTVAVSNAIGLDWDADGNLYVASFDGGFVRRFDPEGNDLGQFASDNLFGPTNLWFDDAGDLWVLDWTGGAIRRYDSSGVLIDSPVLGLSEPEGVEFLANGHFLVGNGGTSSVREYDGDGTFVGDLVPPGSGGLAKPNGLRLRSTGGFRINEGLNDAWFNRATSGQGVFVTVYPQAGKVFIAMFTYDAERPAPETTAILGEPGHRWFTAIGDLNGDRVSLSITLTSGGVFDQSSPPVDNEVGYGSAELVFSGCDAAELTYEFPGANLAGVMSLERVIKDNVALCEALLEPTVD